MIVELILERLDRFLGAAPRLAHDIVCLLARLVQELLPRCSKRLALTAQTCLDCCNFAFFVAQFTILYFVILLFLFELIDDALEIRMLLVDIVLRTRDNLLRQAELSADRKGIARPRYTDQEAIGRPQCIEIELNRGVLHARLRICVGLECRVMRRRKHGDVPLEKMLDDAARKRCPLIRIGACPDLIQQNQIAPLRLPDDADDVPRMRRKGGKALLDALLISDVCVDIAVDGQLRIRRCRQETA